MALLTVAALVLVGCTRHNPASCCTSDAQCQTLGLDQMYACATNLVCDPEGACVAPECQTAADCTSPGAPLCVGQLCVASCTGDGDCDGIAGMSYCSSEGTCVACTENSQCTSDAPVCDGTSHSCRGCAEDSECSGGVCLEETGTCSEDANVVFVISIGGIDAGTCTRASPCASFQYGLQQINTTRNVLYIEGGVFSIGSTPVTIDKGVYVDASETLLTASGSGALFNVTSIQPVTISNASLSRNVTVGSFGRVTFYNMQFTGAVLSTSGGTLAVEDSKITGGGVTCNNGTSSLDGVTLDAQATNNAIETTDCTVTIRRSNLKTSADQVLGVTGGTLTVENNLIVQTDNGQDLMAILQVAPGSTLRFNTIVTTALASNDGSALACDSGLDATSNIFAYESMHPITDTSLGCTTRYSLFDSVALSSETVGTMNKVGDLSTFFVDTGSGNYHLAPSSPALQSGEPNLGVTTDFDGNPRPTMQPDIGAFEAQ
ncbi:MAG TPA: choice-of-anchor Q domain-containing protein [Kofleriaceae bacterium]|jgi:hypothetical protein